LNILHIIGTPVLGGVQSYLLDLSKYDRQFSISRDLLCLNRDDGILKQSFKENGIECYLCTIMPKDYSLRPYRLWKIIRKVMRIFFFFKLFKSIKRLKPDIIVCEDPSYLNTQLLVSKLLSIPFIWHIHNSNQFTNVNKQIFYLLIKYYLGRNLFIIATSESVLTSNLNGYKDRIKKYWKDIPIIPVTTNLEPFKQNNIDKQNHYNGTVIGTLGRLVWQKDYEFLIRVFHKVHKKIDKNIFLLIGGSGPMFKDLDALIIELEMQDYVKLLGDIQREKLPEYFNSLDIYVQSSMTESMPISIKEAMACGLPIISTDVGGIPELISEGETGFLIKPKDETAFTKTLTNVLNMNPKELKKIGESASNHVHKNYNIKNFAGLHSDIYSKLKNK